MSKHYPDIGKLSVAILEHLVKPVLGDEAIKEIKAPVTQKEERDAVLNALANAEKKFTKQFKDKKIAGLVLDLSLASLASVSEAVIAFYNNPTDENLGTVLREQLKKDSAKLSAAQIDSAVDAYIKILRDEFINLSKEFRDKSGTLAAVKTEEHTARTANAVEQLVEKFSAPTSQEKILSGLHSLPSPPADFTGREKELDQLLSRSTQHATLITGLSGMGGVGKTALALVAAHKLAEKFPDAQIYLELKGTLRGGDHEGSPLQPSEAMAFVIHAFDPQADLRQASDDEIAALYRTLLNDKRALLLFDNAADAAQVKPLMPPPSCAMLVTSRKHFTLAGLQPIRLDVMSESEARDLLLKIAPRLVGAILSRDAAKNFQATRETLRSAQGDNVAVADVIARLCGYLPLALEIAAGFIAEHADVSVETYASRLNERKGKPFVNSQGKLLELLKKDDEPDLNVEAAFALSYDQMTDENRARWRALAVFPAPFDAPAAASVWQMEEQDTREILSKFYRANILQFDESSQRYQLHDLLQEFADARLSEEELNKLQKWYVLHYLVVIQNWTKALKDGQMMPTEFLAESVNLHTAISWLRSNKKTLKDADELSIRYHHALKELRNALWKDADELTKRYYHALEELGDALLHVYRRQTSIIGRAKTRK
ncbi:MAG: ATP-binding protein [Chloroflexi bacterium]|nr:ATP-binding protein [Chloroflexota bacterium]